MTSKIDAKSRRWVEAAKVLGGDPKASVPCPKCGQGTLKVIDAPFDVNKIDRYMQCPVCQACCVMTLLDRDQSGEQQGAPESSKE